MPQFDVSSFGLQLIWLSLVFGALYLTVSKLIAPKAESILINRNRYFEDNIHASEIDQNKTNSLFQQKEQKLQELNAEIAKLQKDATDKLDEYFFDKNVKLTSALAQKTQESFSEIQNYLNSFGKNEEKSCIDLAAFIIEKITDKPADLKLLKKIYGTK